VDRPSIGQYNKECQFHLRAFREFQVCTRLYAAGSCFPLSPGRKAVNEEINIINIHVVTFLPRMCDLCLVMDSAARGTYDVFYTGQ
jgi:hypothetical protein